MKLFESCALSFCRSQQSLCFCVRASERASIGSLAESKAIEGEQRIKIVRVFVSFELSFGLVWALFWALLWANYCVMKSAAHETNSAELSLREQSPRKTFFTAFQFALKSAKCPIKQCSQR